MDIKEASEQVKGAVRAYLSKDGRGLYRIPFRMQRPIIMMGPPGVGKTAVARQVADELGVNFVSYSITHHTRQSALGLPFITTREYDGTARSVSEYTMSEIVAAVFEVRERSGVAEGILLLDEMNCVSETLAPAMLQFLQYKTLGMHSLPEGWVIVTAGNPPEYNRSAREFDSATLDRLMRIDVEPDLGAWREYALARGMHPAVMTYLEARPENFYRMKTSARGPVIVTPRGWEDLSRMLQAYEAEGMEVHSSLPGRYLQDGDVALDFGAYYELFRKYEDDYKVVDILDGRADAAIGKRASEARFDERVALVGLLLDAMLRRVRDAVELEEALRLVRKDLLDAKPQLEGDEPAVTLRAHIESAAKSDGVRDRLKNQICDGDVLKAERLRILNAALSSVEGDASTCGFKAAKSTFNGECKRQVELAKRAVASLDNSFMFLDAAFGEDSQEALIYLTKLSVDPTAARLVGEYGSAEFMRRNKGLLFEERGLELLKEIKNLD